MPKFRYTGTAQNGGDHGIGGIPVVWDTEKSNVDSVINGGVFLCMRPGFYYFTAALSKVLKIMTIKESEFTSIITQSIKCMPGKYLRPNVSAMLGSTSYISKRLLQITENNLSAANYASAKVEITLELDLYDMVQVKKNYEAASFQLKNYFEGRMLE